jgi:hypothetical protein
MMMELGRGVCPCGDEAAADNVRDANEVGE